MMCDLRVRAGRIQPDVLSTESIISNSTELTSTVLIQSFKVENLYDSDDSSLWPR